MVKSRQNPQPVAGWNATKTKLSLPQIEQIARANGQLVVHYHSAISILRDKTWYIYTRYNNQTIFRQAT